MARPLGRRGLRATFIFVAVATTATLTAGSAALAATQASTSSASSCGALAGRGVGHISGVVRAVSTRAGCAVSDARLVGGAADTPNGSPPLIFHGGREMGTSLT